MSSAAEPPKDQNLNTSKRVTASDGRDEKKGMLLGLISAVGYSATNLALRQLSDTSEDFGWDIWVSAMKAIPTLVVSAILLLLRKPGRGPLYPSWRVVGILLIAALVMQFGGNLCFQIALGNIGLAISVPFVFALIIFSGAFFGRLFVGDTVSKKTIISICIMTVSVIMLSYAASQQQDMNAPDQTAEFAITEADSSAINMPEESVADSDAGWSPDSETLSTTSVQFGIFMAIVSGLSYGINGIVIRGLARNRLTVPSMTIIYSTTGFSCLSLLGMSLLGIERIQQIAAYDWLMMLLAGSLNAVAFFSITNALKLLDISRVNVINASQNAMCAIGAFLVFAEPMSGLTVAGIVLSVIGLGILDRK